MKIFDLIVMCLGNLNRRKVRTALTVVGVVVGTCAIMVMISLGVAMKVNQEAMLAEMGDLTIIQIQNYGGATDRPALDDAALLKIQAMEDVDVVTPFWNPWEISLQLISGNNERYTMQPYSIVGVYPEAIEKMGYELIEGRFGKDNEKGLKVVIGENMAYSFIDTKKRQGNNSVWPEPDPITGKIKSPFVDVFKDDILLRTEMQKENIKPIELEVEVIGRLKQDWSKGYETSEGIFMDINDLKKLIKDYNKANGIKTTGQDKGYQSVKVKVTDITKVKEVETAIQAMGYDTWSMEQIREPMEKQARQQQMVLGGLGAISLFVAAIGITNTMVMSIYERTREIGVMKVLGCVLGDIRKVFLLEAGFIGFMGGVVGIVLSYVISFGMNYFSAMGMGGGGGGGFSMGGMGMSMGGMGGSGPISVIPLWLVGMSLVFATLIGLVSGFYPANRAVKISALEAIKHE